MMKEGKKYPCEDCVDGIYMNVEGMWWCDKHLKYACQMEKNRLCEKFNKTTSKNDAVSRQAVLDMATVIETDDYNGNEILEVVDVDDIKALPSVASAPKKCHNKNKDYDDCDQFVCSNCGIELQDWHQVERDEDDGDITYHEYEFRFCPNCGARIVKEV